MSGSVATKKPDTWPIWLRVWFWIQLIVIGFDCAFVLLRPHSFPDGALGWAFPVFHIYMQVDKIYGNIADPFGWAQSVMCLIENAILAFAMFVLHPKDQLSPSAASVPQMGDFVALIATSMQFGKSIYRWLLDYSDNFGHVAHNSPKDFITLYAIPNAIWLIGPPFVFAFFAKKFLASASHSKKTA
jgi:hypothetical protein